jgi:hypothetical protein
MMLYLIGKDGVQDKNKFKFFFEMFLSEEICEICRRKIQITAFTDASWTSNKCFFCIVRHGITSQ